ncbi:trihelix transcription factor ENAP2 isoform X2 [Diospyros lotus]|uniref:trihelix transcription factor ENAP2 isoform X2 n=1 Tax=Diospyros lotus TaxID=55363 RepID=UPI00225762F5|nr:trihelix transcription factor ENAP2 isoform X2 [Diospyros lotus]
MEKEASKDNPSLLSNPIINATPKLDDSPRKLPPAGDRLKRDEWSEGAVSSLLEAYESKWILRNRAKLKGQDWEDVAKFVSSRANCSKSPKTQTQCKNKIESMKKRYRSESATADSSSWPLFPRLDLLLRGSAPPPPPPPPPPPQPFLPPPPTNPPLMLHLEPSQPQPAPPPPPHMPLATAQNSHGSNGADRGAAKEDGVGSDGCLSDKNAAAAAAAIETDSSTPALYSSKEKTKTKTKTKTKKTRLAEKKRRRRREVGESIRWLAEVMVRSEQARMETMRELERMRAEAEAKRGELDLKRTEIVANTQLEIARLFAGVGESIDSSLKIGRS